MRKWSYISVLQETIVYRGLVMGDKSRFVPFFVAHQISRITNQA
jgi:hypothetical protein